MPSIRILAAGAAFSVLLVSLAMTPREAGAQTAANTAPGKPIPLLQIAGQPDKTTAKPHAKKVVRAGAKTHFAAARRHHPVRAAAAPTVAAAASVWLAPDNAPPAPAAAASDQPRPTASGEPTPSELVVAGRTVQVVSPDDANDLDRAADAPNDAATTPSVPAAPDPAPQAAMVAPAPTSVGSASWIAEVLAALGGAVAAGSLAWFMMGSAPHRMYG